MGTACRARSASSTTSPTRSSQALFPEADGRKDCNEFTSGHPHPTNRTAASRSSSTAGRARTPQPLARASNHRPTRRVTPLVPLTISWAAGARCPELVRECVWRMVSLHLFERAILQTAIGVKRHLRLARCPWVARQRGRLSRGQGRSAHRRGRAPSALRGFIARPTTLAISSGWACEWPWRTSRCSAGERGSGSSVASGASTSHGSMSMRAVGRKRSLLKAWRDRT